MSSYAEREMDYAEFPGDDHNATCPFCGGGPLRASITHDYGFVPLREDGYDVLEGDLADGEITYIECYACGREVPVAHYWHTPEKCDCRKEVK